MPVLQVGAQEALGIHVEGQQLMVAHLRRQGRQIRVLSLRKGLLAHRLDSAEDTGQDASESVEADVLGLDSAGTEAAALNHGNHRNVGQPETNSDALYRLITDLPTRRCRVGLSLLDGRVFYTEFPGDFDLKGKKLKRRLLAESQTGREEEQEIPQAERHAYIRGHAGKLLSIVHDDPMETMTLLDGLQPFIGRVEISLIDPLEVVLMNLVRAEYPGDEQVTAVVYLGQDFSQVVFMQQGEFLGLSPPIREGSWADDVLDIVSRRIVFTQHTANLPDIGRILLAGDCRRLEASTFFAEQFPESQVKYLTMLQLDLESLDRDTQPDLPAYAVPVGLAWKALDSTAAYPTNFLPNSRRRLQNALQLGWHSLVVLTLLMVALLGFGRQEQQQQAAIRQLDMANRLSQQQLEDLRPRKQQVLEASERIGEYESRLALLDTLAAKRTDWSGKLGRWAEDFQEVGSSWLLSFATDARGVGRGSDWTQPHLPPVRQVYINGKIIDRAKSAELAQRLGHGQIRSLTRDEIRGQTVYDFDMVVPVEAADTNQREP